MNGEKHNRKMYEEMVKQHHEAKEFEMFKSIFLWVMIAIAVGILLCGCSRECLRIL